MAYLHSAHADANEPATRTTFPTFLDADPYPTSGDGRPMSALSTATSDFESVAPPGSVPSTTGPVGEAGLPPSRPASGAQSPEGWSHISSGRASFNAPPSRRGLANFGPRKEGDASRPNSSMNPTHVPSLPGQGFFRPMSSQRLQAQRGQNVAPQTSSQNHRRIESVGEDGEDGEDHFTRTRTRTRRYSNASVNTAREAEAATRDGASSPPPPPVSRDRSVATSFGDDGPHDMVSESVVSKNSTTPLHTRRQTRDAQRSGPVPKSPRSLRESLGFGSPHSSKKDFTEQRPSPHGREKLPSEPASPTLHPKEKLTSRAMKPAPQNVGGRNYEYFAGNLLFVLSGRCLNTRAKPLNLATFVLTVLPAALFFAFEAPWLWQNISPAIPIVFAYIFFVALSAFLHAAFSDPGILPRNLHPHPPNPDEERDPLASGPATTEWVMVKTFPGRRNHAQMEANVENGSAGGATTAMEVPTKYCKSCNIWRPPRAHHCRVCDACIETQDHHCVWLNNCVGRRNYRYFFAYVGFSTAMALMLIAVSLAHIGIYATRNNISFGASMTGRIQERMALAMLIYAVLAMPYPGSLFGYHLFLIARGETTREYLNGHKFLPKDRHRPFSQASILNNWIAVLVRPRPPSYMSFKRRYTEGDIRFGHTLRRKDRSQKEKLEAVRSASRIDGMKKRFSVSRREDINLEMKPLPSMPGTGNGSVSTNGVPASKLKNRPAGLNSTPR